MKNTTATRTDRPETPHGLRFRPARAEDGRGEFRALSEQEIQGMDGGLSRSSYGVFGVACATVGSRPTFGKLSPNHCETLLSDDPAGDDAAAGTTRSRPDSHGRADLRSLSRRDICKVTGGASRSSYTTYQTRSGASGYRSNSDKILLNHSETLLADGSAARDIPSNADSAGLPSPDQSGPRALSPSETRTVAGGGSRTTYASYGSSITQSRATFGRITLNHCQTLLADDREDEDASAEPALRRRTTVRSLSEGEARSLDGGFSPSGITWRMSVNSSAGRRSLAPGITFNHNETFVSSATDEPVMGTTRSRSDSDGRADFQSLSRRELSEVTGGASRSTYSTYQTGYAAAGHRSSFGKITLTHNQTLLADGMDAEPASSRQAGRSEPRSLSPSATRAVAGGASRSTYGSYGGTVRRPTYGKIIHNHSETFLREQPVGRLAASEQFNPSLADSAHVHGLSDRETQELVGGVSRSSHVSSSPRVATAGRRPTLGKITFNHCESFMADAADEHEPAGRDADDGVRERPVVHPLSACESRAVDGGVTRGTFRSYGAVSAAVGHRPTLGKVILNHCETFLADAEADERPPSVERVDVRPLSDEEAIIVAGGGSRTSLASLGRAYVSANRRRVSDSILLNHSESFVGDADEAVTAQPNSPSNRPGTVEPLSPREAQVAGGGSSRSWVASYGAAYSSVGRQPTFGRIIHNHSETFLDDVC